MMKKSIEMLLTLKESDIKSSTNENHTKKLRLFLNQLTADFKLKILKNLKMNSIVMIQKAYSQTLSS